MEYQPWKRLAVKSAQLSSRTARGVADTSVSPYKPQLTLASSSDLALQTGLNLEEAAAVAWDMRIKILSKEEIREFLDRLARIVNKNLFEKDRPLYRTWEVNYPGPVIPAKIEHAYATLCERLAHELVSKRDLIPVAAELEKSLNLHAHPFADGCSRVSRIAGAWVLLRQNLPPAFFDRPEEYYRMLRSPERERNTAYRIAIEHGIRQTA